MNKAVSVLSLTALFLAGPVLANPELAESKMCMACHAVDKKLVGPSYKDVAAKYAGKSDAADMLVTKIMKGGVGNWGQIPMPANPQVSAVEAKQLAEWILLTK